MTAHEITVALAKLSPTHNDRDGNQGCFFCGVLAGKGPHGGDCLWSLAQTPDADSVPAFQVHSTSKLAGAITTSDIAAPKLSFEEETKPSWSTKKK